MPFLLALLPVLIIEALVFWAVGSWLGVGWALLIMFGLMAAGLIAMPFEMRRVGRLAAGQKISAGRLAGDYGLLTAGAILAGTPGIATSILGLLLILPPTRALARRVAAKKMMKSIEDLGVRSYEATASRRPGTTYGSFGDPEQVIDEQEVRDWTRDVRPEDFK
ncbi:FxsA family protein [Corynebacterium sp.]|uniref:FxsA family protein n=1 Tax=Corynebacterium sp. TaxID=1720 RepID=UPI0026DF9B3B|nr:FxsA family protein [Corynebacterium sp.]MDO5511159.1 FxsA family protein [Corynebacterium sp.]